MNKSEIDWAVLSHEHPILAMCPDSLRKNVLLQPFTKGELLHCTGEQPRAMLCVLAGEVRLVRRSVEGSEIIVQRVREGFIAEASLEAERYHCDMVTAADGVLLRLPIAEFRAVLASNNALQNAWSKQLAREVRKLRAQCERLNLKGAAERIMHYIETEGDEGAITLSQSRKAWAAELGLSHETLYRTLRELAGKKIIIIDASRIALIKKT